MFAGEDGAAGEVSVDSGCGDGDGDNSNGIGDNARGDCVTELSVDSDNDIRFSQSDKSGVTNSFRAFFESPVTSLPVRSFADVDDSESANFESIDDDDDDAIGRKRSAARRCQSNN